MFMKSIAADPNAAAILCATTAAAACQECAPVESHA